MAPGNKPGMNGAAGFQKGLCCESCHSEYHIIAILLVYVFTKDTDFLLDMYCIVLKLAYTFISIYVYQIAVTHMEQCFYTCLDINVLEYQCILQGQ